MGDWVFVVVVVVVAVVNAVVMPRVMLRVILRVMRRGFDDGPLADDSIGRCWFAAHLHINSIELLRLVINDLWAAADLFKMGADLALPYWLVAD